MTQSLIKARVPVEEDKDSLEEEEFEYDGGMATNDPRLASVDD